MNIIDSHTFSIFLQLALSAMLGLLIGFERSHWRKAAGLRTFSLVAMGSTLFTIVSMEGTRNTIYTGFFDPTRIAAQIVVGIGFLGAGLIILQGQKIQGLTTAAALWATAAIGMAVGIQLYAAAIFSTALLLTIIWGFAIAERYMPRAERDKQDLDNR